MAEWAKGRDGEWAIEARSDDWREPL